MKLNVVALFVTLILAFECQGQNNPVIVELFTSQGCSSCPAADENLSRIIQRAREEGKPVFGLSFHVDYWNYLGWKDPYSSKEFTLRQRHYSENMNLQSIYTPQLIVNGKYELIGSNKSDSEKVIEKALAQKPEYRIHVENFIQDGNLVRFTYSVDEEPGDKVINVAVVERNIENFVPKGENQGRKLHHDNVVRTFLTVPLRKRSELEIKTPTGNSANMSVIIYVQDKKLDVFGAASISLK